MDKTNTKLNSAVVIPALNPMPDLVVFINKLLAHGVARVIVVNDGSDSAFDSIFDEAKHIEGCSVLRHEFNRGKGKALKTAFSFYLRNCPDLDGVVTADADGQHSVADICKICARLSFKENTLFLGIRDFKNPDVPKRSYIGNLLTSRIFHLLYGIYLEDTQTGLRGIPADQLVWMADLMGERYDYEMNVLIRAKQLGLSFTGIPIETIYFHHNSGSHYNTVKDSFRILKCLVAGLKNNREVRHETQKE